MDHKKFIAQLFHRPHSIRMNNDNKNYLVVLLNLNFQILF